MAIAITVQSSFCLWASVLDFLFQHTSTSLQYQLSSDISGVCDHWNT